MLLVDWKVPVRSSDGLSPYQTLGNDLGSLVGYPPP